MRNIPAALLLFSGIATAGISSVISLMLIGFFVGATTSVAAENVGLGPVISSVVGYAPIEFVGFLLAASAGLGPILRVLVPHLEQRRPSDTGSGAMSRYLSEMPYSLATLGAALIVLVGAAFMESAIIVGRL